VLSIPKDGRRGRADIERRSFGAKEEPTFRADGAAAHVLGRPVKTVLTRPNREDAPKAAPMIAARDGRVATTTASWSLCGRARERCGGYAGTSAKCALRAACPPLPADLQGRTWTSRRKPYSQNNRRIAARWRASGSNSGAVFADRKLMDMLLRGRFGPVTDIRVAQCAAPGRSFRHRPDHAQKRRSRSRRFSRSYRFPSPLAAFSGCRRFSRMIWPVAKGSPGRSTLRSRIS